MRYLVPVFFCSTAMWAQATSVRAAAPRAPVSAATANPNDAAPPSVRPEDKCLLEGTVVNSITGEPLKKAHLSLRPIGAQNASGYGTITDGAGHFLIDDLDPGRYTFS